VKRSDFPLARVVRDVLGQVVVGKLLVSFTDSTAGRSRFPWRVYGIEMEDGTRDILEDFAQYREALDYAISQQKIAERLHELCKDGGAIRTGG
jgi:hypothetical protein